MACLSVALLALPIQPLLCAQTPPAPTSTLDAVFNQGAEAFNRGDFDTAIASFERILKEAQPGPALEPVHYSIATAKLRKGDFNGAIEAFRFYLQTYPNGAQLNGARAGLTHALIQAKRMPEALAAIRSLRGLSGRTDSQGIDNFVLVHSLTLSISDSLIAENKHNEALELLQNTLWREQIIELQRQRIIDLHQRHTAAQTGQTALGARVDVHRYADRLKDAREALKTVEENADFDLPRLLRLGQCYMALERSWEAIVVYNEVLKRFPASPDRAFALHGLIIAKQNVRRLPEAQALCSRFLLEFPGNPMAPEIAAMGGQISAQLRQPEVAASFFGTALTKSDGATLERVIFQLGLSRFELRDWAGAREMFDRYVREYPQGEWRENAGYRSAISWFLDTSDPDRYGKAEKAIKAFIKNHPNSVYLSDAYYRLAVCLFAFQQYKEAIAACDDWQKRFPNDGLLPQVLSLKADVQKTLGRNDEAIETYLSAARAAHTDEVLHYALGEIGRLLEQKRDWPRIISIFTDQINRQPNSRLALGWYYWVARAQARAGQTDEAWAFLADRVGLQMDNAANEDVEKILELMAQIRARQRQAPADGAAPVSPSAQLKAQLELAGEPGPLVSARLRFYEARMHQLRRRAAEATQLHLAIGRELPPEELSAPLLAVAGEALNQTGDTERAALFFNELLTRFPSSDYRDFAYVGLGDIALAAGRASEALELYTDAIRKASAPHRLREATVGQARSHFALGELDKAATLFETIAAAKQWRGEATALSLYHLGQIAVRQGDLPRGIVFFQRVFVSHVRHPEWVARAYLATGQAFERLGRSAEAAATYREMIRNERIATRPELADARTRLQAINLANP